ncbi:hypothetical protein B0J13DRAFT_500805 [Dactylonectria estremocensis]|uniref:Protein kinase domain-containing protein n=1 Tax=Dactylonectria estremocensis TaxID=1079267 RepID=A0A9P9EX89_9HYPO|nr:hypothetical protein B0J13DRAFT_500805 [Dactylonectria estremocensis]
MEFVEEFGIESFFNICFDAGVDVVSEEEFEKGDALGAGASMTVYRGRWKKSQGRLVAMKYFNASLPQYSQSTRGLPPRYRQMLQSSVHELRIVSHDRMRNHENIVNILAVSWKRHGDSDATKFLVPVLIMELADDSHPTLSALVQRGASLPLRLELLRDVLEGLHVLHSMSVIHGDIKPENVLIFRTDGQQLRAKISDFGVSQPHEDYDWVALGTAYWNAPECLSGAPADLEPFSRSYQRDIYSFGLLACFALLEEKPFDELGWDLGQISEAKLRDEIGSLLSPRWRLHLARGQDLDLQQLTTGDAFWQVRKSAEWKRQDGDMPHEFLISLKQVLQLDPCKRLSLGMIRESLLRVTSQRKVFKEVWERKNGPVLAYRGDVLRYKSTNLSGGFAADTPVPLQGELYRGFLESARSENRRVKTQAMLSLGHFHMKSFGTEEDYRSSLRWFCRAAQMGSLQGKVMLFRLESVVKKQATSICDHVSVRDRSSWMIDCLMSYSNPGYDPRLALPGAGTGDFRKRLDRLEGILRQIDPYVVERGFYRDIEANIVKCPALHNPDLSIREALDQYPDLLQALLDDDPDALGNLLSDPAHPIPQEVMDCLVTVTTDARAVKVIGSLIQRHGLDPNVSVDGELSPVNRALARSDVSIANILADNGADLNDTVPLIGAIVQGQSYGSMKFVFDALLAGTAGVDQERYLLYRSSSVWHQCLDGLMPFMDDHTDKTKTPPDSMEPPMLNAILYNRLDHLWSLLAMGGNPNVRYGGITALYVAVRCRRAFAVGLLLAFGADPNARHERNGHGTPLHDICGPSIQPASEPVSYFRGVDVFGHKFESRPEKAEEKESHRKPIIRLLLEYGADADALCSEGFTPLMTAIASPVPFGFSMARLFYECGVGLTGRGLRHESVFHMAVLTKNLSDLQHLIPLADGELLNAQNNLGHTPLFLAAGQEDIEGVLRLLLGSGADMSIRAADGRSPLDVAMLEGHESNVDILLSHTSRLTAVERDMVLSANPINGRTAAHVASCSPRQDSALRFLNKIATLTSELDCLDHTLLTPIHVAAARGNINAIDLLVSHGADMDREGINGMRALDVAKLAGQYGVVRYLISRVARWGAVGGDMNLDRAGIWEVLAEVVEGYGPAEAGSTAEMEEEHRQRCVEAASSTGKSFAETEQGYRELLQARQTTLGEQHPLTIWTMNNLATAHERYGQVGLVATVFRRGWELSVKVLGDDSLVSQDFAKKFLRVQQDRGIDDVDGKKVSNWMAKHGYQPFPTTEWHFPMGQTLADASPAPGDSDEPACYRKECPEASTMSCPDCGVSRYCSESCRAMDIIDPQTQHLEICVPTIHLEEAADTEVYDLMEKSEDKEGLEGPLSPIERGYFAPSDFDNRRPRVQSGLKVFLNPSHFERPFRYRTKKNSTLHLFLNRTYEICLPFSEHLQAWRVPTSGEMVVNVSGTDFMMRTAVSGMQGDGTSDYYRMPSPFFLIVEWDVDLSSVMERRVSRVGSDQ